jgi:hypothetical protein
MLVGFGDISPYTKAGKFVIMLAGIMGLLFSSLITVTISAQFSLSL